MGCARHHSFPGEMVPVTIRVLVADDQALVRSGLRLILNAHPDITVVAEATDGIQAVQLARTVRPDVCLVDIRMPGLDGIAVTRALAGTGVADPLRVVIVTTFDLDDYVFGAVQAGAVGFVLKGAAPALLVEAVRAAHDGNALISPEITLRILQHLTPAGDASAHKLRAALTEREMEVVRAVAAGRSNADIASLLFISLSTVKSHLASIQTNSTCGTVYKSLPGRGRTGSPTGPDVECKRSSPCSLTSRVARIPRSACRL